MSKRGNTPALKDILEAIHRIERYVGTMGFAEFLADTEKQDAVVRNLEIMGEAVKSISAEFRQQHKDIEWGQIAGFRDKLIHHYFGVNWKIVWDVIQDRLPRLKVQVADLLKNQTAE